MIPTALAEIGQDEWARTAGSLPETTPQYGDAATGPGELLTLPPDQAAKRAYELWRSLDKHLQRQMAQWRVNEYRREGITEAKLSREMDRWVAWIPKWARSDPNRNPQLNKLATLLRKLVNVLMADPPVPEAVPGTAGDGEADIDAAEFTTRALVDVQGEAGLNSERKTRRAVDFACTYGSGFERFWVDPRGGGKRPIEVQAGFDPATGEQAEHLDQAVARMVPSAPTLAPDGMSMVQGEPTMEPWPAFRPRFLAPDGSLTDDRARAALRYLPAVKSECLRGTHVRLFPHTVADIWDAHMVQTAAYETWGKIKRMFPDAAKLPDDVVRRIQEFQPDRAKDLVPPGHTTATLRNERNPDESLVFVLTTYAAGCGDYEQGLYMLTLGDAWTAYRTTMQMPDGEPMLTPVTQYKLFEEGGRSDPYGVAPAEILGPGNDIRAGQIAAALDWLDRANNLKTFVPTTSNLDPREMEAAGRYVRIIPGSQPFFEQSPPWPEQAWQMYQTASEEMDAAIGLGELAQGLDSENVESGRQAYAIISQAHAQLSEPNQAVERGFVRGCRITLELIKRYFDTPREIDWVGEDGAYKQKAWSSSDIGATRDVRLQPGTNTMLTPAAKAQLAEHFAGLGVLDASELRDALASNVGGMLALQDNPMRMRVRRQLAAWSEGPEAGEEGEAEEPGENEAAEMQQQLASIFAPVPSDGLPAVAQIRLDEIGRFMQSERYQRWPTAWRAGMDQEFARMQQIVFPPQPAAPPPSQSPTPPQQPGGAPNPQQEVVPGMGTPSTIDTAPPPQQMGGVLPGDVGVNGATIPQDGTVIR